MEQKTTKILKRCFLDDKEIVKDFILSPENFNCRQFSMSTERQLDVWSFRNQYLKINKQRNIKGLDELLENLSKSTKESVTLFSVFEKISKNGFILYLSDDFTILYGLVLFL